MRRTPEGNACLCEGVVLLFCAGSGTVATDKKPALSAADHRILVSVREHYDVRYPNLSF
jgi:hypothetical protein